MTFPDRLSPEGHEHIDSTEQPKNILVLCAALTGLILIIEVVGGTWSRSLAVLSDAGHVLVDLSALLFSLFALRLAERPTSDRRTFGFHRLEVLSALGNAVLLGGISLWIFYQGLLRFQSEVQPLVWPMFFLGVGGLIVNVLVAWLLHGFSRRDLNLRGAYLHVASDALASGGVVLGALVIRFTGWFFVDPLVGCFIAAVIGLNALRLAQDSLNLLLEGVPGHLQLPPVIKAVEKLEGVVKVEDPHLWGLCSHLVSFSTQIIVDEKGLARQSDLLVEIRHTLRNQFQIHHATLEIQFRDWDKSRTGH